MKLIVFLVFMFGSCTFAQEHLGFIYTSLNSENCASFGEMNSETEIDYGLEECPGFAGYRVYYAFGDARSWLELEHLGIRYTFQAWELGDAIKGFFPYVSGELAEWRYRISGIAPEQTLEPYTLIYRMNYQDSEDASKTFDTLIVVRFEENQVCYLSSAMTNEEARALADDLTRGCSK